MLLTLKSLCCSETIRLASWMHSAYSPIWCITVWRSSTTWHTKCLFSDISDHPRSWVVQKFVSWLQELCPEIIPSQNVILYVKNSKCKGIMYVIFAGRPDPPLKSRGFRYEDLGAQSHGPTLLPIFRDDWGTFTLHVAKWGEALLYCKYKNSCVLKEHHLTYCCSVTLWEWDLCLYDSSDWEWPHE